MSKQILTQDALRALVDYNHGTGLFTRKVQVHRTPPSEAKTESSTNAGSQST